MRHGSLFTGIGGFDLAAQWMGWENIFQVEWDLYCQKVLAKNFPNVKRYGDIKEFDGTQYRGLIDIITGGFPCQPFSTAGKQKGKGDDRYLWPEMFRVIREIQPTWVVGENVPGIIKLALEDICLALEGEGYEVQPFIIPSASIGAWDKRDRGWIIAYNNQFRCDNEQEGQIQTFQNKVRITTTKKQNRGQQQCRISKSNFISTNFGLQRQAINEKQTMGSEQLSKVNPDIEISISEQSGKTRSGRDGCTNSISDTIGSRRENRLHGGESERQAGKCIHNFKESDWWKRNWIEVASELCRSNARVSNRMDRIKALGNSVNPYVVFQIFKAIDSIHES